MGKPKANSSSTDVIDELKKGPWTPDEDKKLVDYISKHGHGRWRTLPKNAGLRRCGKSCRLRWINYLRPGVKRGTFSPEEEDIIMQLHSILGNRWSAIAAQLPGRTDNEIKNYWNTRIKKRIRQMDIDSMIHSSYFALIDELPVFDSSICRHNLVSNATTPFYLFQEDTISPFYNLQSDHFLENVVQMQDVQNCNQELDCLVPNNHLYPPIIAQTQRSDCQYRGFFFESTIPKNMFCCENTFSSIPPTNLVISNNDVVNDEGRFYSNNGLLMSSSSKNAHVLNNCFEFLSCSSHHGELMY